MNIAWEDIARHLDQQGSAARLELAQSKAVIEAQGQRIDELTAKLDAYQAAEKTAPVEQT